MKNYKKELVWILGTIILCLIIYFLLRQSSTNLDDGIRIYATFIAIQSQYILVAILIPLFFLIYLGRIIVGRFNNPFTNSIFLGANLILIICLCYLALLFKELSGNTLYPPLSAMAKKVDEANSPLYYDTIIIIVLLVVIEIFVCFKTWRKFK
jgi:hypothetical protein